MKKLRVLVLVREGLEPPESLKGLSETEIDDIKVEYDVAVTLENLGHDVRPIGVYDDLSPLRESILNWKPQVVFMLLEEFHGIVTYDHAIVGYLELMRQPYTGCNPRGLMLTHDKGLMKEILSYHRIPTPRFVVFKKGQAVKRPKRVRYPIFVKSTVEDASLGISQASIVNNDEALAERVKFVHDRINTDALAEEYIPGRELYVGIIGNKRLQTLPVWEMDFSNLPDDVAPIASRSVKWNPKYQKKHGITTHAAKDLPAGMGEKIARLCKRVYRSLHMSGYARMDLRLREDGRVFVVEANANPNLAYGEDFAESAATAGIKYEELLSRIVNLGLRYDFPWRATI